MYLFQNFEKSFIDNKQHIWAIDFNKTETQNALKHVNGDSWTTIHILKITREWIEAVANESYSNF